VLFQKRNKARRVLFYRDLFQKRNKAEIVLFHIVSFSLSKCLA